MECSNMVQKFRVFHIDIQPENFCLIYYGSSERPDSFEIYCASELACYVTLQPI